MRARGCVAFNDRTWEMREGIAGYDQAPLRVLVSASDADVFCRQMEAEANTRLPTSFFVFLVFVGALQGYSYAGQMPDPLATHFGASGLANGWQSKAAFFSTELGLLVLAAVLAFGVPRMMASVPLSLVNLPNKEYWFSPERRAATLAFFRAQFAWFGCALLAFLLFVNELVFRANLAYPHRLNGSAFTIGIILFFVFVATWTIRLAVHFSRKLSA